MRTLFFLTLAAAGTLPGVEIASNTDAWKTELKGYTREMKSNVGSDSVRLLGFSPDGKLAYVYKSFGSECTPDCSELVISDLVHDRVLARFSRESTIEKIFSGWSRYDEKPGLAGEWKPVAEKELAGQLEKWEIKIGEGLLFKRFPANEGGDTLSL